MSQPPPDDLQELWGRVRGELRASLPQATYRLWLEPLKAVAAQGSTLQLSAPETIRVWVERRYSNLLRSALAREGGALTDVALVPVRQPGSTPASAPSAVREQAIDSAHTFGRFVIGPGSRFAHAAALAVAELPGDAYNPLFLHGPPGLGKSHLLGAIALYIREHNAGMNVRYTTAESFTSEFVSALRSDGPEAFKRRYRNLDALLIDDIQVLEGKARTEEEFVHTFNALHAAGKQIVLSSDRPPAALARLEQRLRDRFDWGLTVAIEPPDLRTRMNLLWRLAADAAPQLPDAEALRALAAGAPGNVRLLEGALTRALALASLLGQPLDGALVKRALADPGAGSAKPPLAGVAPSPSIAAIQEAVCSVLGIDRDDLRSPRRTPRIARARQLAMYLARDLTGLSLAQIARDFERDHSTVLYAIRAVEGRLEPGSRALDELHRVRASLGRPVGNQRPRDGSVPSEGHDPQPPAHPDLP